MKRLFVLVACGCVAPPSKDSAVVTPPLTFTTHNVGTTPWLSAMGDTPHRETCETWYGNNLCTTGDESSEAALLHTLQPDLAVFAEVWPSRYCDAPSRPAEADAAPYACALPGDQLDRVLPTGLVWSCMPDYPDLCLAWRTGLWSADGPLRPIPTSCQAAGRMALLSLVGPNGPITLGGVHLEAGLSSDNHACRMEQLEALSRALPEDGPLILAGDFNFDPGAEGPEAHMMADLADSLGLRRLADDGPTSPLLGMDLDAVYVRGFDAPEPCALHMPEEVDGPMFDHALVMVSLEDHR